MSRIHDPLTPPRHQWTEKETHHLLRLISQSQTYKSTFFPPRGFRSSDTRYKLQRELCLDVLKGTEWMRWCIQYGMVRRVGNGGLEGTEAWRGGHDPVSSRMKSMEDRAKQIRVRLGPVRSEKETLANPSTREVWKDQQNRRVDTWYFAWLALKIESDPTWLRGTDSSASAAAPPTPPVTAPASSSKRTHLPSPDSDSEEEPQLLSVNSGSDRTLSTVQGSPRVLPEKQKQPPTGQRNHSVPRTPNAGPSTPAGRLPTGPRASASLLSRISAPNRTSPASGSSAAPRSRLGSTVAAERQLPPSLVLNRQVLPSTGSGSSVSEVAHSRSSSGTILNSDRSVVSASIDAVHVIPAASVEDHTRTKRPVAAAASHFTPDTDRLNKRTRHGPVHLFVDPSRQKEDSSRVDNDAEPMYVSSGSDHMSSDSEDDESRQTPTTRQTSQSAKSKQSVRTRKAVAAARTHAARQEAPSRSEGTLFGLTSQGELSSALVMPGPLRRPPDRPSAEVSDSSASDSEEENQRAPSEDHAYTHFDANMFVDSNLRSHAMLPGRLVSLPHPPNNDRSPPRALVLRGPSVLSDDAYILPIERREQEIIIDDAYVSPPSVAVVTDWEDEHEDEVEDMELDNDHAEEMDEFFGALVDGELPEVLEGTAGSKALDLPSSPPSMLSGRNLPAQASITSYQTEEITAHIRPSTPPMGPYTTGRPPTPPLPPGGFPPPPPDSPRRRPNSPLDPPLRSPFVSPPFAPTPVTVNPINGMFDASVTLDAAPNAVGQAPLADIDTSPPPLGLSVQATIPAPPPAAVARRRPLAARLSLPSDQGSCLSACMAAVEKPKLADRLGGSPTNDDGSTAAITPHSELHSDFVVNRRTGATDVPKLAMRLSAGQPRDIPPNLGSGRFATNAPALTSKGTTSDLDRPHLVGAGTPPTASESIGTPDLLSRMGRKDVTSSSREIPFQALSVQKSIAPQSSSTLATTTTTPTPIAIAAGSLAIPTPTTPSSNTSNPTSTSTQRIPLKEAYQRTTLMARSMLRMMHAELEHRPSKCLAGTNFVFPSLTTYQRSVANLVQKLGGRVTEGEPAIISAHCVGHGKTYKVIQEDALTALTAQEGEIKNDKDKASGPTESVITLEGLLEMIAEMREQELRVPVPIPTSLP